jgi:hypothetical protein
MVSHACETSFPVRVNHKHIRRVPSQAFAELSFARNAWAHRLINESPIYGGIGAAFNFPIGRDGKRSNLGNVRATVLVLTFRPTSRESGVTIGTHLRYPPRRSLELAYPLA